MSGPVGVGRAQEQDEQQDQEQEKRMDHQEQALRSPLLASQRPEFRTMSIDSQQFLQHALSVDGEALQQYLEHETGAHFMRLSPMKQSGLGVAAGHGGQAVQLNRSHEGNEQDEQDERKGCMETNEAQLADMMHSLVDDPHFDVGLLQSSNLPLGGELLSADTLDRVLGAELQDIASDVRVKLEDGNRGLTGRVLEGIQGKVGEGESVNGEGARLMPPPKRQEPRNVPKLQISHDNLGTVPALAQSKNQYVTFMNGNVLQRDDGSPAIVTFPENSMAASIQVPVPGSDAHLQFVPLLNSTVSQVNAVNTVNTVNVVNATSPVNDVNAVCGSQVVGDNAAGAGILSPSQTERIVADAVKQHAELVNGVEARRKSADADPGPAKERKPQLRQVDSEEFPGDQDPDMIERKVSHKRERSVTLRELPNLELDKLPSAKLLGVDGVGGVAMGGGGIVTGVVGQVAPGSGGRGGSLYQNYPQFPNANYTVAQVSEFFAATDVHDTQEQTTPTGGLSEEDARKHLTAYIKPLKLFGDGLDELLDDEIRRVISNTLETPPGTKRRGRPPGRSKNIADILPDGWVEPSDAEILANLLLEKPHMKTLEADELKKNIRKEKNKISAAMSRVRLQNETRDLEGQIRRLEEEHSSLSEWLSTGNGRRNGEFGADEGRAAAEGKNTLIRHFSL